MASRRRRPPWSTPPLSYPEAQIFGEINLSRDLAKIVVDEGDLDQWADGTLSTDTLNKLKPRPKAETKGELIAWAKALGVPIQFINSGRNKIDPGQAGPHLSEVAEAWEGLAERVLSAMAARQWAAAQLEVAALAAQGKEPVVKNQPFKTYGGMGLGSLKTVRDAAEKEAGKKGGGDVRKRLDTVAKLAHEALTAYLVTGSAVPHEYRTSLEQVTLQTPLLAGAMRYQQYTDLDQRSGRGGAIGRAGRRRRGAAPGPAAAR